MRSCIVPVVVVACLLAVGVLVLGYLGFVPGVASVFGSDKPRDLGVRPTAADLQSANVKTGVKLEELPPSGVPQATLRYSGKKAAAAGFSDRELTAMINNGRWVYDPVSDCQVKINPDGTAEASGILRVDRLSGYAAATGIPADAVSTVLDRLKVPGGSNPPFYLKGRVSVTDNRVSLDTQQVEVGRFGVPSNWISDYKGAATSHVEERIKNIPGLTVKSFTLSSGSASFDGTLPEVEATSRR